MTMSPNETPAKHTCKFRYKTQVVLAISLLSIAAAAFAQNKDADKATKPELSLNQAISEASEKSPRIQKAHSAYEEAGWKKVETYGNYLPTVTAGATYLTEKRYMLTDINFGGSPVSVPQILPTSIMTLTATLPLFDGFASTNRYWSAQSLQKSAEHDWNWAQFEVERDITLQFYKALGAQQLRDVAEQNVKTLEDHLKDVNLFKRAGVSTNYDVLRVDVQVSEAKSELLNSSDNVETSKAKLAETMGEETEMRDLKGQLPVLSAELINNVSLQDVSERKDLIALKEKTDAMSYMDSSNGRFWVPRVSAFGQYQYYNNLTDGFSDRDSYREAYNIGLSLTWNIFDGLVSVSKSQQSAEQKFQTEKSLQMAQLKAKQDLDFWKRKFVYFCTVYRARVSDIDKATESVRLAKEGRKVGSRTNTDLLDAESELFKAKAGAVNAQLGAIESLIQLELSTGKKLYNFN